MDCRMARRTNEIRQLFSLQSTTSVIKNMSVSLQSVTSITKLDASYKARKNRSYTGFTSPN